MVGLGCLPGEDVYRVVDWRSVVFLACLLPLSGVLLRTRAVDSLVAPLLQVGGSPLGTFAALYAAAILLNQLLPSVAA
ncbi:MAG: potassium transporter TrkA, partial [candidate division GAL15 bacterium]